ncbi:MAG: recombinase family protein [Acidobacteriia bacterium]|nr:recombinase family protein [Terriglobia bacterium]
MQARPALARPAGTEERQRRLLADVEAGVIDCVVVYKVDRLSRSLVDFARLMETFEKRGVAFVSITQQFNSANSIGRLTLNILLSFAQFEREIIAERTRDKMSAARRKGKWIGGIPVLGYDVDRGGGRLVVNPDEAKRVRGMFELYLQHRTLIQTVKAINARRWTTKQWITEGGREHPGKPITKNLLYRTLTNPLYVGKVRHKGKIYDGEHEAIVDAKIWKRVNDLLQGHNVANGEKRNRHGALLRGLLCCEPCGVAMVHTYTVKGDRRYRYYSCLRKQQQGASACPSNRLAAGDIESAVVARIRGLGTDPRIAAETYRKVQEQANAHRQELESALRAAQKEILRGSTSNSYASQRRMGTDVWSGWRNFRTSSATESSTSRHSKRTSLRWKPTWSPSTRSIRRWQNSTESPHKTLPVPRSLS